MKKLFFVLSFLFLSVAGFSQEIGLRFGDVVSNDIAVDAIFPLGSFSRVHGDVSFGTGVGIEALWDCLYRPLGQEPMNWYVGVGPSLLLDDPFLFGASGEIGLEYHFKGAPIALGLDWRPTLFLIQDVDFSARGFGFNVRYVFGKK